MKTKSAIIVLLALHLSVGGFSQGYQSSLGGRGGVYNGISFKYFVSSLDAIEIVGAFYRESLFFAAMYQMHNPISEVSNLNWYYGFGAHFGFFGKLHNPDEPGTRIGGSGNLGLEYKFERLPVTIGLDVLPSLDVFSQTRFWIGGGIAIRYVFQ